MRLISCILTSLTALFQSTHPLRDATVLTDASTVGYQIFQSTHPLRDATPTFKDTFLSDALFQSTHPLRDATKTGKLLWFIVDISIHAPLTGCDCPCQFYVQAIYYFNPRTPYGMRHYSYKDHQAHLYFNPRTPYGMRPPVICICISSLIISIHAPLTGCDTKKLYLIIIGNYFNPRTPYGMRHLAC